MFSYIGAFEVFEEDTETTRSNVIKASFGFSTSISAALLVSAYLNQWTIFVRSIIGGIAGICLGFNIYSIFVAIFIKSLSILIPILIAYFIGGIVVMWYWYGVMYKESHATVLIGACTIIHGLSVVMGE
jgi:pheromone shutdown protein TraB